MAKVELKKPIVEEISANIKDAQSVVLVDYRGLTVDEDTRLRKELRENNITYKVYKNTFMNFAFKGTDFEALAPYLEGPSAIAISTEDATAPARILAKFAKTAQALEIKAGVVEGTVYDAQGIEQIAKVPSREELLSKLLGSLQSPITNLARVLNQIAEKGGAGECAPAEKADEAPAEEAPAAEEAKVEEAPAAEEAKSEDSVAEEATASSEASATAEDSAEEAPAE
ncbi:large subunit ribosomal protein L10 [Lachnospiraceae bacterium XBB2008]|nr:large subunit ribosomal protein L10 [Lachnospiraceae bacterium XBB2008]